MYVGKKMKTMRMRWECVIWTTKQIQFQQWFDLKVKIIIKWKPLLKICLLAKNNLINLQKAVNKNKEHIRFLHGSEISSYIRETTARYETIY